jgi:hypothetical protein
VSIDTERLLDSWAADILGVGVGVGVGVGDGVILVGGGLFVGMIVVV